MRILEFYNENYLIVNLAIAVIIAGIMGHLTGSLEACCIVFYSILFTIIVDHWFRMRKKKEPNMPEVVVA